MKSKDASCARILVVDDDDAVRDLVAAILRSGGYDVSVANDGRQALTKLANESFDVVVTDLVMPEQEGIETIRLIRRDFPAVKVIAMSGAFGGDYLRIAGHLGAHGTIAKPAGMQTVLETVRRVLQQGTES